MIFNFKFDLAEIRKLKDKIKASKVIEEKLRSRCLTYQ